VCPIVRMGEFLRFDQIKKLGWTRDEEWDLARFE
jgi:hypothetical protein